MNMAPLDSHAGLHAQGPFLFIYLSAKLQSV